MSDAADVRHFVKGPASPAYVVLLILIGGGGTFWNQHQTKTEISGLSDRFGERLAAIESAQIGANGQVSILLERRDRETDRSLAAINRELDDLKSWRGRLEQHPGGQ